jgi:hypothetical protein
MTTAERNLVQIYALQELVSNTRSFLQKNTLVPGNAAGSTFGVADYAIDVEDGYIRRPGSILGKYKMHLGLKYKIKRPNELPNGYRFKAIYLPVQPSNSNFITSTLPDYGEGTNLMITTQLTGCSVIIDRNGNSVNVAHIQPKGETGIQLQNRLIGLGHNVFGAIDYPNDRAIVIGARSKNGWNFFAQVQDPNFNVRSAKLLQF